MSDESWSVGLSVLAERFLPLETATDAESDDVIDSWIDAVTAMINLPAPGAAELRWKLLEVAQRETGDQRKALPALRADAERLLPAGHPIIMALQTAAADPHWRLQCFNRAAALAETTLPHADLPPGWPDPYDPN